MSYYPPYIIWLRCGKHSRRSRSTRMRTLCCETVSFRARGNITSFQVRWCLRRRRHIPSGLSVVPFNYGSFVPRRGLQPLATAEPSKSDQSGSSTAVNVAVAALLPAAGSSDDMAYAYPADPASSSSSLVPGLPHILAPHSRDVSRQSSGGGFDVLLVIKVCFSAQYSAGNAEW